MDILIVNVIESSNVISSRLKVNFYRTKPWTLQPADIAHRKWKETKLHPSMLPGPAVPGSCLVSFHFL